MQDLYSTLFYKVKFSIEAKKPDLDLLWQVIYRIKEWQTQKHNRNSLCLSRNNQDWTALKCGGQIVGKNVRVFSEYCNVTEPFSATYWACKIIESPEETDGCAPRQWTTEIGFEPIAPNKAFFSCVIFYSDRPGFVGKCKDAPNPSVPNIVKALWGDNSIICRNGIDTPAITPTELKPGDWKTFWERLNKPERALPYIYISPLNHNADGSAILLNPQTIAMAAGGNAIVYYASDIGVTDEMNYFCPDSYKCYDGALRIYYPNIDESNVYDAQRHRFLGASFIRETGEDGVVQIIHRAIAQDAKFYETFFRTEDCQRKRSALIRQKRLDELKQQHSLELLEKDKQTSEIFEQAVTWAEDEEKKRLEAEDLIDELTMENRQLSDENFRLSMQNDSYRMIEKENTDLKKVCDSRLITKELPKGPNDIVNYFDAVFCDKIAFSDSAMGSIRKCRIPLEDMWKAMFSLATSMQDLYLNGQGDIFKEFRLRSGIDVSRGEGMMTHRDKSLMKQFQTDYHGETINIEAHITYPRLKQSIHFGFSHKEQKVIVGWCGEHMDIYSTKKMH